MDYNKVIVMSRFCNLIILMLFFLLLTFFFTIPLKFLICFMYVTEYQFCLSWKIEKLHFYTFYYTSTIGLQGSNLQVCLMLLFSCELSDLFHIFNFLFKTRLEFIVELTKYLLDLLLLAMLFSFAFGPQMNLFPYIWISFF